MTATSRQVDLVEEIEARHKAVREVMEQFELRLEQTRGLLATAGAATAENARLREQVRALTQRLPAVNPAGPPAIDPNDHGRLLAERDALLAERDGLHEERDRLAWEMEVLLHEKTLADERVRSLETDLENLFVEAGNLDQQLAEARREQQDAEELAGYYARDNDGLTRELAVARDNLADEELRRRALERSLQDGTTLPNISVPTSTPQNDLATIGPAIESLAGAARTSAEAAPAILTALSTLGELVRGIAERQRTVVDWVEIQRQGEAAAVLAARPALASDPVPVGIEGLDADPSVVSSVALDTLSEPPTLDPKIDAEDTTVPAASSAIDKPDEPAEADPEPGWEEDYARVELAWLAGLRVGDGHQGRHFLTLSKRLGQHDPRLRDATTLLGELDALGRRFGEGFSYCLLDTALAKLRRPVLNPTLLIVEMNHLKRRRYRHHD